MTKTLSKYNFSITKGSLLPEDSWTICLDYLEIGNWEDSKIASRKSHEFKNVKDHTFTTKFGLIKSRVDMLPRDLWFEMTEYEDFVHALYLSACLKHKFFGDLVLEVVREQYLLLQTTLTEDHFRSFLYKKMDQHPEVEQLKEYTLGKLRQNCMRMLSEADVLVSTRKWIITKPLISNKLAVLISEHNNSYLKYYLLSDHEIDNLR